MSEADLHHYSMEGYYNGSRNISLEFGGLHGAKRACLKRPG